MIFNFKKNIFPFVARPVYLPVRSLLTVETFSISSSVAVDKSYSTLRYNLSACETQDLL